MLNIYLIQPEKTRGYTNNSRTGCYAPLGLISIATYIKHKLPNTKIKILDGELITNKEIISKLEPTSIVCIDTKIVNYVSALEIAKAAKKLNCKVIVGGVYATALPREIMKNNSHLIDHLVVGFGEKPMINIINGSKEQIIYNVDPCFDELPPLDRSFVDLDAYIKNFHKEHPTWNARAANIFTHMGCKYKCIFCSRQGPKHGVYLRNPKQVWDEVTDLVQKHKINYIVDFSDAITQKIEWLREFIRLKPEDINPTFHVFSTAEDINEETIGLLKRINVRHIFIGAESGDRELAAKIMKGKHFSPDVTLNAIKLLTAANISITPSFVLGLPGETEETLEHTYNLAKKIHEITNFEEIFCSALIPFPGSIAFNKLKTDSFDPEELKQLWIKEFCNADYETIMSYVDKILALGKYTITIKKTILS